MPFSADHFASTATPLLRLNQRPWKIFYRGLTPKPLRNKINAYASRKQMYHTAELWRPFLQAYFQGQLPRFNLQAKQDLRGQKIIWQYWGQGLEQEQLPEMVRLCFRSVEQNLGDYRLIRLDDQTLHNYLDLPDFVQAKRQNPEFKPAFFADLLRLALLDVYGGVWLDASILLTAPLPKEWHKQISLCTNALQRLPIKTFGRASMLMYSIGRPSTPCRSTTALSPPNPAIC